MLKFAGSDEKAEMRAGVRATALFPGVKDSARSAFVASRALLKARKMTQVLIPPGEASE